MRQTQLQFIVKTIFFFQLAACFGPSGPSSGLVQKHKNIKVEVIWWYYTGVIPFS